METILQFLFIDLKPNTARDTYTNLTATFQGNLLPLRKVNWNNFRFVGVKGKTRKGQSTLLHHVYSAWSCQNYWHFLAVKWSPAITLEHPLPPELQECVCWAPVCGLVWFFPSVSYFLLVSQPDLELLHTSLFTRNVLKQYLHLNIAGDCFCPP